MCSADNLQRKEAVIHGRRNNNKMERKPSKNATTTNWNGQDPVGIYHV